MSEQLWVRSHVERLLQDEWDLCRVTADDDGDYGYRFGTAACWVSVLDTDPILVRVFAHAVLGVRASYKLLTELNEIQNRTLSAVISHHDGLVTVSQTISPIGLTGPVLAQAMQAVGGVADDIGLLLAAAFGGSTPYPVELPESEDAT